MSEGTGELAAAMSDILTTIYRATERMPSSGVRTKAARLLGEHKVVRDRRLSIVYHVRTSSPTEQFYDVILYMDNALHAVVDARCTCPASTTCAHIVTALTRAQLDGHPYRPATPTL